MALCTLPPPINLLAESYHHRDVSADQKQVSSSSERKSSTTGTMDATTGKARSEHATQNSPSNSSQGEQLRLPGFKELIQSMPEVSREIYSGQASNRSPPSHYSSTFHAPRPQHSRTLSGRPPSWHPYSPPLSHRTNQTTTPSRTPSPSISERSSNADSNGQQPRSARPTYTEEEIYFIWYHRDDLGMGWNQVLEMFNTRFGKRERNGVQGIQCRYYRALEIHHVPKSRARDRSLPNESYGVRQRAPEKWWPWMHR